MNYNDSFYKSVSNLIIVDLDSRYVILSESKDSPDYYTIEIIKADVYYEEENGKFFIKVLDRSRFRTFKIQYAFDREIDVKNDVDAINRIINKYIYNI